MTMSVIKVISGGMAVSKANTPYGYPCVLSTNSFGVPITVVASGGLPIADATIGGGIFSGIQLSATTFLYGSAQGTAIGNLSVIGGSGTYVFSLTNNAGGKVQVAGTNGVNLQVGATASTVGSYSITVQTTGGTPNFTQSFLITCYAVLPVNTVLPLITGTPDTITVGSTLSTTNGTWTGTPTISFAQQWKRNGGTIPGATASNYLLDPADINATISVTVTATNPGGSVTATSIGVGPIVAGGGTGPSLDFSDPANSMYIPGIL